MVYNPKDNCPDCGKLKSREAKRCGTCAGKIRRGQHRPPQPKPPKECTRCGKQGKQRIIGLEHEEIHTPLCDQHSEEAYNQYTERVKAIALQNLTNLIKVIV